MAYRRMLHLPKIPNISPFLYQCLKKVKWKKNLINCIYQMPIRESENTPIFWDCAPLKLAWNSPVAKLTQDNAIKPAEVDESTLMQAAGNMCSQFKMPLPPNTIYFQLQGRHNVLIDQFRAILNREHSDKMTLRKIMIAKIKVEKEFILSVCIQQIITQFSILQLNFFILCYHKIFKIMSHISTRLLEFGKSGYALYYLIRIKLKVATNYK